MVPRLRNPCLLEYSPSAPPTTTPGLIDKSSTADFCSPVSLLTRLRFVRSEKQVYKIDLKASRTRELVYMPPGPILLLASNENRLLVPQ